MSKLRESVIETATTKPLEMRAVLEHSGVHEALAAIGIDYRVMALHLGPGGMPGKPGAGATYCSSRGMRHPTIVTCKRCLSRSMAAGKPAHDRTAIRAPYEV